MFPDLRRRPTGTRGFTLVEVLVALTVLALVLGTAYRLLGDGVRGVQAAEFKADALAIAEAQLSALGAERTLQPGSFPGEADGFRWTLTVEPNRDPPFDRAQERGMGAFDVAVTVTDPRGAILTIATTRLVAAQ